MNYKLTSSQIGKISVLASMTVILFAYQNCVSPQKEIVTKELLTQAPTNVEVDIALYSDCEDGGITIKTYLDSNLNGKLDEEEIVKSTKNVCNGKNGINAGIITKPAPIGTCTNSGIEVTTYIDSNANGSFDNNETITSKSSVCNGNDGSNGESSQITATKATTIQCPNGGVVYTTSTDYKDPTSTVICNGTSASIEQNLASSKQCPTGGIVVTTKNSAEDSIFSVVCNGSNAYITTSIANPFQCENGGIIISTWTDATNPQNEVICNGQNASLTTRSAKSSECLNGGMAITTSEKTNVICNGIKGDTGEVKESKDENYIIGAVGPIIAGKNYSACHHDFIYFPNNNNESAGWLMFRHQKNGNEDQGIGSTGFNVWNVDIANFNLASEVGGINYCSLTYDPKLKTLKYTVIDKSDGQYGKTGTLNLK